MGLPDVEHRVEGIRPPLGTILMGVIADVVGVRAVLVAAGALVALVLVGFASRRLLRYIDPDPAATARGTPSRDEAARMQANRP